MPLVPRRRRIVHVVYSFAVGGLENVIVQLINRLPAEQFEHVVLSLTTISDFKNRITQPGVRFIELHKQPGHAIPLYPRIYKLLRELKPDVVHTCNLAALEITPLAWLARVPLRVHAEHGWDAHDPHGRSKRYQLVRQLYKPFVSHYVAVSADIDRYLAQKIRVTQSRRSVIANGVDTDLFSPASAETPWPQDCPFQPDRHWLVGTVGRLQTVKNQPLLARAFVRMLEKYPEATKRVRLVIVGDGPLRAEVQGVLQRAGRADLSWVPGSRDDIPDLLRALDCFVLPSQAEGTSCTLQEAMSSALPVIATAVGGTPALLSHGSTGWLVPCDDLDALAESIWQCFQSPQVATQVGHQARDAIITRYGVQVMIKRYQDLMGDNRR